jgi:hypothetical protein
MNPTQFIGRQPDRSNLFATGDFGLTRVGHRSQQKMSPAEAGLEESFSTFEFAYGNELNHASTSFFA